MSDFYEYIKRSYGASFYAGDTVEHIETGGRGKIGRVKPSREHYVQVAFDGRAPVSCHPEALKIIARGRAWEATQ